MRHREWIPTLLILCCALLVGARRTPDVTHVAPDTAVRAAKDALVAMLRTDGIRPALAEFRRRVSSDPDIAGDCHPIAHALGRAAFEIRGDFAEAMAAQDDVCNSGYVHGVIELLFATTANAERVAADACGAIASAGYRRWSCWHGIGHGHMAATANDLPEALTRCGRLDTQFDRDACANGAFMENFNADESLHPTRYLSRDDLFHPCADVDERFRNGCYFYAPTWYLRLHRDDYAGALRWCLTAPEPWRGTCAAGVGSQAMKENVADPRVADRACESAGPEFVTSCVDGMTGLYVHHHASLRAGFELCGLLMPAHRASCEESVRQRAALFATE